MSTAPQAPRRPHEHTEHGVLRPDPYHWLRDAGSPDVLAHLVAERSWYDSVTGHVASLIEELRAEMARRTPPSDSSVSYRCRRFSYYTHAPAGSEHPQLLRYLHVSDPAGAPGTLQPPDDPNHSAELLLDSADLAGDSTYVDLGLTLVSPDERILAYSYDVRGDEVYRLRFRDLESGDDLPDDLPRTYFGGAWGAGSDSFLYTVHDDSYRPFQVWRHRIGTAADEDELLLEEGDPRFELRLRQCRTGRLAVIWARSPDTTEVWTVDTTDPTAAPRSVGGRREGVSYHAEHVLLPDGSDDLLVVTDDGAREHRLMLAPVPRTGDQDHRGWRQLLSEDPAVRLERVDAFAEHAVLSVRTKGERRLRVFALGSLLGGWPAGSAEPTLEVRPQLPAGTVHLGRNVQYDTHSVVVADGSYVHPWVWSSVDLGSGGRSTVHRQQSPGHDPDDYVCERREFPSADGVAVPATVVRHRDTPMDGSAPALLYGYGAYEAVFEPEWDVGLPCLLDRGVVFVHAHVRGGGEGGRGWYLDGRLDRKQNTFSDQIAVADGLVRDGLVDGSRLATRGLSAGGLLQGAVFSQRPDRWRAVVAEVPFVDVVTTMFDATVPLTPQEWGEWGDPRKVEEFGFLLAYSPYDNLPPAGGRPDLLVTGAVNDPRVLVGEPAKWVALLRHTDPDWSPRCLFRVETGEGAHTGPSGRFAHQAYEAEVQAWLLDRLL
ncbi:MAG: Protease II [uncultured Nocardioidaceae bacterium]|uniref:Protease II n=1 Tax=uncultured Nocardioidaceae bacterium TaxID=253824 RepID=A0A6J4M318_9ACTN|nr:MAG: Protease II [uncultured Nocardioidaceae bacterium]